LGRRPDGYHELRTIFQAISLHDTLELESQRSARIDLTIEGNDGLAAEPSRDKSGVPGARCGAKELGLRHGRPGAAPQAHSRWAGDLAAGQAMRLLR